MSEQEKKTTLGEPMYVESLLSPLEWSQCCRKYSTYTRGSNYISAHHTYKPNSFKWRKGMGDRLTQVEIENINNNLDYLLKKAGLRR